MAVKQGRFSHLDIALDHIAVLITFWLNAHSSHTVQFVLRYTVWTETVWDVKHHLIRSTVTWECQHSEPQWKKPPCPREPTWPYMTALREREEQ